MFELVEVFTVLAWKCTIKPRVRGVPAPRAAKEQEACARKLVICEVLKRSEGGRSSLAPRTRLYSACQRKSCVSPIQKITIPEPFKLNFAAVAVPTGPD